jgi:threonine/homoserine/homoserine lactone efflux protein
MSDAAPVPDLIVPYVALIALLTVTPGPDMLLVLRNGLRAGTSAAWLTGVGCCTGIAIHAVAATIGLSAILAASAEAFTVLKLAGAAYLIWLGLSSIAATLGSRRDSGEALAALARSAPERARIDSRQAFRQGLVSNLLNPKIAILFLTLLPQFVADGEPRVATTALLATTFVVIGLGWMRLFSLAIGPISRVLRRGAIGEWIERATGAALVMIGIGVALERR